MDAQQFSFGFRVGGGAHETRRLVTWRKAFAAHCAGEVDTHEAYLSAWTYGPELVAHLKATGGVAGYAGPTWADWLPIDIDGVGPDPVADALDRTRRLLAWLESQGAGLEMLSCWFSGGKGFHVLLPNVGLRDARPGPRFHATARAFVARIGQASGCGPDLAIYDAVRIFRAPNTRHAKTGLFKIPFRGDELLRVSAATVRGLAVSPQPCDAPEPEPWCDWNIGGLFEETEAPLAPAREDRHDLNRATLDFIKRGAVNGERERRAFMAAANLAELGADERLATALLLEAALDSGLSPNEAKRAIAGGVKHGSRAA